MVHAVGKMSQRRLVRRRRLGGMSWRGEDNRNAYCQSFDHASSPYAMPEPCRSSSEGLDLIAALL
jgi:hypothetical protein